MRPARAPVVALALAGPACDSAPDAPPCPPGMVLVGGTGTLGLAPGAHATVPTIPGEDAPERRCPAALAARPGAVACWIQTDLVDPVLRPRPVTVAPFCVESHPYPGAGHPYTTDGMTTWDATQLQALLAGGGLGGRRLCTMTELQAAAAGLDANLPIVYGRAHDPARCPPDQPIGADPRCANPETGVHELGAVHSHWVVADAEFVAHACDQPPCRGAGRRLLQPGALVVGGGTGRLQTRQAPLSPHTWHDHGTPSPAGCDDMGHDDQPLICADPDPGWATGAPRLAAEEAAWQALRAHTLATGRMTPMLSAGRGFAVCPPELAGPAPPAPGGSPSGPGSASPPAPPPQSPRPPAPR